MRIAIPSETADGLKSTRSGHFGHTPYFTIVNVDDGAVKDVEILKNVDHDAVGCGGVIQYAIDQGIDAMITVGMGVPPLTRFNEAGITVYSERETPIVGDVVKRYLDGECEIMSLDDACRH